MKLSAAAVFVLSCGLALAAAGCGRSGAAASCRPASAPDTDSGAGRRAHARGEGGLGTAPSGPLRGAGAALPRDRPTERLLQLGRRVIRRRYVRLRQADDADQARRLSDDRPADVRRLRSRTEGDTSAAAAAAHVRRRARGLVDRLREHPAEASLHRRHVRRRRPRLGLRSGVPDVGRAARDGTDQPLEQPAPRRAQRPHVHPVRLEHEPDRPVLRVQEAGRGLLAVAGPRQVRHRGGAEGARRTDSGVQAARLRPSLRGLRTGRDERRADPLRSPRLALGTLRGGVHAGRERARSSGSSTSLSAASRSRARRAAASSTPSCRPASSGATAAAAPEQA